MCDANENDETGCGYLESLAPDLGRKVAFLVTSGASDSMYYVNLLLTAWGLWSKFTQLSSLSNMEEVLILNG